MPDLSVESNRDAAPEAARIAVASRIAALSVLDLPTPLLLFDAGLRIGWLSRSAACELRLDADEAIGRRWQDLFPDSLAPPAALADLIHGARETLDLPPVAVPRRDAPPRHYQVSLRPMPMPDEDGCALLGVGADITDRLETEAALRLGEQRFRAISQHSRDLVIVCSREGQIRFMSSAIETISGQPAEQRLGGSVFERLHPDDAMRARASIGGLVRDASRGIATRLELRLAAGDGGWRWIECTAANLLSIPAVDGIVLNCRDITDRKRTEAALAAADAHLDTALRTSRTACWSIDVDADRVTMSPHFFDLTGIDPAEWDAGQHPWYSRMHPDDYAVVHRAFEDCLAGHGESYECDYRLRTPAGWLWLQDRGRVAERDAAGRPRLVVGTSQDAGWRKRMEEALRESARDERRRLNDELHDGLGQELSGIQFMLAGIATQLHRDASPQAVEVDLALALISQSLATTRSISRGLEPANPKNGGLRAALQQLATDMALASGAPVHFDAPAMGLPAIPDTVSEHLCRMVHEALGNACRHGGGARVALGAREVEGALEVSVSDAGPGLPADFAQSPGMGLRILAYRARMVGAQLQFDRAPEGGARVRIRYPLAPWQPPAPA